jgi:integrase
MARSSFQRGSVELRRRRDGWAWVLRYRARNPSTKSGWEEKTEFLAMYKGSEKVDRAAIRNSKTPKEVARAASERMAEINAQNGQPVQRVMSFEGFAKSLWQSYVANKNYKPSTVYGYQSMLDNFVLPGLGKQQLDLIRPEDLTAFFKSARAKGVKGKYLLNLYSLIRLMFEVAVEYDMIGASPVRKKLHRPHWERQEKPALLAEEIRRVIENIPDGYRTLFITDAVTGLRLGELLALRWSNLSFDRRELSVTHNLWRGQLVSPKTRASVKSIRIPAVLVSMLEDHRSKSRWIASDDFIFCREDGSPLDPDTLRKHVLYPAITAAGITRVPRAHGFHLFRHSAGSIVHSQTRDLKMAQELLRHSRIDTTADVYVHVDGAVAEEATEALAKVIIPNCGLIVAQTSDRIQ